MMWRWMWGVLALVVGVWSCGEDAEPPGEQAPDSPDAATLPREVCLVDASLDRPCDYQAQTGCQEGEVCLTRHREPGVPATEGFCASPCDGEGGGCDDGFCSRARWGRCVDSGALCSADFLCEAFVPYAEDECGPGGATIADCWDRAPRGTFCQGVEN